MITWPASLVTEIAERRCVIFMGAGTSAGCLSADGSRRPADWRNLLLNALSLVKSNRDQKEVGTLINKGQYLDAAQIIVDAANPAELHQFYRSEFDEPNFQPSDVQRLIHLLDAKTVITTNYDIVYESYCTKGASWSGYNVRYYYDDNILDEVRSRQRLIIKAHGCVKAPSKIILTRAQYFHARRHHQKFYAILDALFLSNTILFVGCGLSDPDIQLVLENANISAPSAHPHYAVAPSGRHKSIKSAIKSTYNIELLEYTKGQHSQVTDALRDLQQQVQDYRTTHPL